MNSTNTFGIDQEKITSIAADQQGRVEPPAVECIRCEIGFTEHMRGRDCPSCGLPVVEYKR